MVQQIVPLVLLHMREGMDTETMQPFIGSTWRLIQKVVIAKTPGHQPASLEVRGQIASILAAMDAATIMEKRFEALRGTIPWNGFEPASWTRMPNAKSSSTRTRRSLMLKRQNGQIHKYFWLRGPESTENCKFG